MCEAERLIIGNERRKKKEVRVVALMFRFLVPSAHLSLSFSLLSIHLRATRRPEQDREDNAAVCALESAELFVERETGREN